MSTAIKTAIGSIHNRIPRRILEAAFNPHVNQRFRQDVYQANSIDNLILQNVINRRVRLDCDTLGSEEVDLLLENVPFEHVDTGKYIIHVPKSATNNRVITSVLSLNLFPVLSMYGTAQMGLRGNNLTGCGSIIGQASQGVADALRPMVATETSNLRLISENTVLVEDMVIPSSSRFNLRCILTADPEFTHLARPAWITFGELCVLACKAYIYNTLILEIDQAQLVAGRSLGEFKNIVDSYSDADELYQTMLYEKWGKIQYMSDEKRMNRHIHMLVGRWK